MSRMQRECPVLYFNYIRHQLAVHNNLIDTYFEFISTTTT